MYLDKVLREQETIHYQRDSGFKSLIKNMKAVADSDYPVPAALSPVLRNYQKTGYRWLKTMETAGFGGILADDHGPGQNPAGHRPAAERPGGGQPICPLWWYAPLPWCSTGKAKSAASPLS